MRTRRTIAVALLGASALTAGGVAIAATGDDDGSAALAAKIDPSKPKNVILFVGDGMGDSEVTLARYYGKGAAGRMNMDRLPFRGSSIHYVLSPGPGPNYAPNYVGDSAPTGTAWSTGKRTQDNRLSQGPSADLVTPGSNAGYTTFMELAKRAGKATGNVSTAEITDATPAAPSSHISQRACQGPVDTATTCPTETKAAGGLGSIAEQQVDEGFDLYLGGARARYLQPMSGSATDTTGPKVTDYATSKGYSVVNDKAGLAGITSLAGGKKVLGLFNATNMITDFQPLFARTDSYLTANATTPAQQQIQGGSATTKCLKQDRANEPSLNEMTTKALDLLDDDPDGFSLQVEGASIDKRDHAADVCGQIGETLAMDDAIGTALEFQRTHPDTLIIMTADHAHSSQAINSGAKPATGAAYATVQTVDGAPLRVAYGTSDTGTAATTGGSQTHTGAEVPVWAIGPQASNIQGTIDETDIFRVLNGLTPSTLPVKTVTTPGPAVPGPAVPVPVPGPSVPGPAVKTPLLGAAINSRSTLSQLRSSAGIPVAVTASNISSIKVTLKKGTKTLTSKTLTKSGSTSLRYAKATKGTYKVTVTGGGKTASRSVSVK